MTTFTVPDLIALLGRAQKILLDQGSSQWVWASATLAAAYLMPPTSLEQQVLAICAAADIATDGGAA